MNKIQHDKDREYDAVKHIYDTVQHRVKTKDLTLTYQEWNEACKNFRWETQRKYHRDRGRIRLAKLKAKNQGPEVLATPTV